MNYLYTSDIVFVTNNTIKYFTNLIRQRIYYTNSLWNIWSPQSIIWNERIHWGPTTPITTIGPKCHGLFVTYYSTYHHHLTSIRYIPHMEHDIPVQNTCSHSKYLNIFSWMVVRSTFRSNVCSNTLNKLGQGND